MNKNYAHFFVLEVWQDEDGRWCVQSSDDVAQDHFPDGATWNRQNNSWTTNGQDQRDEAFKVIGTALSNANLWDNPDEVM